MKPGMKWVWVIVALLTGGIVGYALPGNRETYPEALVVQAGGGTFYTANQEWKLLGPSTEGRLSLMEITESPVREFRDAHVHTREEEGWYVIEGELEFEIGSQRVKAAPGTLVWAPRNVPHRYRVSKGPARYLLLFSPAGIEGLFKEVAVIRDLKPGTPEHAAELEKRRAKYGARAAEIPSP